MFTPKNLCLSKFWKRQIYLVVFHLLYSIHFHPFYIEIKFLAVYYIFYSPLSSLYEPNGIFTPFILCINISFKINTCKRIPTKLTIDRSKKKRK